MSQIRSLFSTRRAIDRRIEKVIDYSATAEDRLLAEIDEYEATENVENCFRKLLDNYRAGVEGTQVSEIGVWVSGFYGSGKSSFTKYFGLALKGEYKVGGRNFVDLLTDRLQATDVQAELRTVAKRQPAAIIFLDLGAEQLAENASSPVSEVLYWKVLHQAGYSKDKKLAQLELTLDRQGKMNAFKQKFRERWKQDWLEIHNDPLIGTARAAQAVPEVLPKEFPTPESFSRLRFELGENLRDRAQEMIDLIRNQFGTQNIVFMIDEAGQYVAPRTELMLNLDGLVRNLKELGRGKVWMVCTGQQTLTEISQKAQYNSAELTRLQARFPITIELDARDIKEITYRRLLTKTPEAMNQLKTMFRISGQALIAHTRLTGTTLYKTDPDAETFAQFYPFLPQHFELLIELIRQLARGSLGLRSAIKVIQDVLVDVNRLLPAGVTKFADREVGTLACADDFYNTLRADILKVLPHVVAAVDRTEKIFGAQSLQMRIAKTVAALQNVENLPCSAENISALLYSRVDSPGLLGDVQDAIKRLLAEKEIGLIEDPKAGGYVFLSDKVRPLQQKRGELVVTSGDLQRIRRDILGKRVFDPPPSARLENTKEVKAGVRMGNSLIVGDGEDIVFWLEAVTDSRWDSRRTELLTETVNKPEWRNGIAWLYRVNPMVDDLLEQIYRSEQIASQVNDRTADRDEAQFQRAELKLAERNRDEVEALLRQALLNGTLVFRGRPTPAATLGETVDAATRNLLGKVAQEVFEYYRLAPVRVAGDQASKFLSIERMDHITHEQDPLRFVVKAGGTTRVDVNHPALAETLRAFRTRLEETGGGRLQGNAIQDIFSSPPYGWSKDTVRYLFAALLVAGSVEYHTAEGTLKVAGPKAAEACKSTVTFNKIGVSLRDAPPDPDALDRAARRLEEMFGDTVLPLEDNISRAVRQRLPDLQVLVGALPDRLRLLGLAGQERARVLLSNLTSAVSGDATGAIPLFGAKETTLVEDIRWARAVAKAFDENAEEDVQAANALRNAFAEMQMLFPGEDHPLLAPSELETLSEALRSERFYEQLANIRSIVRAALERTRERYAEVRREMETGLRAIAAMLEAHPDWPLLLDEDRAAIMGRLQFTLPLQPSEREPVKEFQVLLQRRNHLPGLQRELEVEIARRLPSPPPAVIDAPQEIASVALAELQPPALITNETELDNWLKVLRARLVALLRARKQIRFE